MSIDVSREPPKGKRTQTRKGHTMMYGAPHAHASRVRAVEANSPPPWGSAWPIRPGRTALAAKRRP
eukprot:11212560-Lingulodinium_polyedra.AAC.1